MLFWFESKFTPMHVFFQVICNFHWSTVWFDYQAIKYYGVVEYFNFLSFSPGNIKHNPLEMKGILIEVASSLRCQHDPHMTSHEWPLVEVIFGSHLVDRDVVEAILQIERLKLRCLKLRSTKTSKLRNIT